jgi:PEP-CTERM motif
MNAATVLSGVREMKNSPSRPYRCALLVAAVGLLALLSARSASADTIGFNTFVTGPSINAVLGQQNTIGFTYAGNEFVGSVYFGSNNLQLYSTNLTGGNVQKFGSPIPQTSGFNGEPVLAASLGQGGFPKGDIYAAAGVGIYHYANSGGSPTLFGSVPTSAGTVRQVFFDPGSSFGGNMIATTSSGNIYQFTSAGVRSLIASTGEDTEGVDIAPGSWGSFGGDLLTASEGSGKLRLISPGGSVTVLGIAAIPEAETVSFVPTDLDPTNPLQGFYVANYPVDIQFASASQFVSQNLLGDAIITSEDSFNARVWDVHYNGGTSFTLTQFTGNLPNQSEDGIFVSGQRQNDLLGPGGTTTPEPGTLFLLATGGIGLLGYLRRRGRRIV